MASEGVVLLKVVELKPDPPAFELWNMLKQFLYREIVISSSISAWMSLFGETYKF